MPKRMEGEAARNAHDNAASCDNAASPSIQRLDAIERAASRVADAVEALDRKQLLALANRLGVYQSTRRPSSAQVEQSIKRRLIRAKSVDSATKRRARRGQIEPRPQWKNR